MLPLSALISKAKMQLNCIKNLNITFSYQFCILQQRSNEGTAGQNSLLDFIKYILSPLVAILLYIKALFFGQAQVSNATNSTSNVAQKDEGVSQKNRYVYINFCYKFQ